MENNIDVKKVAELNDQFRKTFIGGRVTITDGVDALSDDDREQLFNLVKNFDTFTEDNDPYGEHDFGAITFKNEMYFFKIDYYDLDYLCLSPDISALSPKNTPLADKAYTIICKKKAVSPKANRLTITQIIIL